MQFSSSRRSLSSRGAPGRNNLIFRLYVIMEFSCFIKLGFTGRRMQLKKVIKQNIAQFFLVKLHKKYSWNEVSH